jgi:hypothetical protein
VMETFYLKTSMRNNPSAHFRKTLSFNNKG